MGFFAKKDDPISQRARKLNEQIAALESQIQRLNVKNEKAERQEVTAARTRSTKGTSKRSSVAQKSTSNRSVEPVFEELKSKRIAKSADNRPIESADDLGMHTSNSSGLIRRFLKQFQSVPPSNPKLVSYLAAGSIQGLRPLRYEKRVARNRFLFLMVFLILLLLGILTSFIGH